MTKNNGERRIFRDTSGENAQENLDEALSLLDKIKGEQKTMRVRELDIYLKKIDTYLLGLEMLKNKTEKLSWEVQKARILYKQWDKWLKEFLSNHLTASLTIEKAKFTLAKKTIEDIKIKRDIDRHNKKMLEEFAFSDQAIAEQSKQLDLDSENLSQTHEKRVSENEKERAEIMEIEQKINAVTQSDPNKVSNEEKLALLKSANQILLDSGEKLNLFPQEAIKSVQKKQSELALKAFRSINREMTVSEITEIFFEVSRIDRKNWNDRDLFTYGQIFDFLKIFIGDRATPFGQAYSDLIKEREANRKELTDPTYHREALEQNFDRATRILEDIKNRLSTIKMRDLKVKMSNVTILLEGMPDDLRSKLPKFFSDLFNLLAAKHNPTEDVKDVLKREGMTYLLPTKERLVDKTEFNHRALLQKLGVYFQQNDLPYFEFVRAAPNLIENLFAAHWPSNTDEDARILSRSLLTSKNLSIGILRNAFPNIKFDKNGIPDLGWFNKKGKRVLLEASPYYRLLPMIDLVIKQLDRPDGFLTRLGRHVKSHPVGYGIGAAGATAAAVGMITFGSNSEPAEIVRSAPKDTQEVKKDSTSEYLHQGYSSNLSTNVSASIFDKATKSGATRIASHYGNSALPFDFTSQEKSGIEKEKTERPNPKRITSTLKTVESLGHIRKENPTQTSNTDSIIKKDEGTGNNQGKKGLMQKIKNFFGKSDGRNK